MDFVSKALGSLSLGLPFTLGTPISAITDQPWKLYDAVMRKDSVEVSVFEYSETNEPMAQNASAALRKLKLPGVVKYIDMVKSGKNIYIITERVKPFDTRKLSKDALKYILKSILQTLGTMENVAKVKHNSVCVSTVLQSSSSGKPLLVGFDLATADGLPIPSYASVFPSLPYPQNEGWTSPTLDTYQFGQLVSEFLPEETRLVSSLKSNKRPNMAKLVSSNSAQMVLRNPISDFVEEIAQVALLPEHDLTRLCEHLDSIAPSLYPTLVRGTILHELFRTKSTGIIFHTCLLLIASLAADDKSTVLPAADPIISFIVAQFQSMDRVVRLELLRYLPQYISLIPDKVVQQNIMSKMVFGFGDNEVLVRKASVAAVEYLADKLTTRQLNSELLRLLAKTHNDVDPDVRALTTTVLCRLAPRLESRSVISTALGRALKDPVPRCRNAALRGVSQIDVPAREIAEKLLGPAATGILDQDPNVSAEAWRVTDLLLSKIRAEGTSSGPAPEPTEHHTEDTEGAASLASRKVPPEVPSAVPTPLSTLRRAPAQHHSIIDNAKANSSSTSATTGTAAAGTAAAAAGAAPNDEMQTETEAWGWDDAGQDDNEVEDAWGWNEPSTEAHEDPDVDEDAWGW